MGSLVNMKFDKEVQEFLTASMDDAKLFCLDFPAFYEKYKEETPAVGHIMIWSTDRHLSGYEEEVSIKRRKDR